KSDTGTGPFDVPIDENSGLEKELPTGSGFWAVQPSLSWIAPSDPAVFFGNFSYLWSLERDTNARFGRIDPGDAIGVSLGGAVGLNERTSLSLGYEHYVVLNTKQNGAAL